MLTQIVDLLVNSLLGLLVYLGLLRFFLQAFRAPFRNPLGEFVIAFTDWGVKPLRRIVPGLKGMDLSSLAFAFFVQLGLFAVLYFALMPGGAATPNIVEWLVLTLLEVLRKSLHLLFAVVIVDVILSWVNPQTPFAPILASITRPMYGFFRRFIPPMGGFDLAPLFVIIAIQIGFILLNGLQSTLLRML